MAGGMRWMDFTKASELSHLKVNPSRAYGTGHGGRDDSGVAFSQAARRAVTGIGAEENA